MPRYFLLRGISKMMVRKAESTDLESISGLSEIWEQEDITYGLKANTAKDLLACLENELWIAVEEVIIVGYLIGEVKRNTSLSIFEESDRTYFEIEEIYIHPDRRGRGIGEKLLKEVTENLKQQGITRMTVSTANKDWKNIIGFYEKFGFKTWTMTLFK
ncbi:GNAT family N-acetyltransferase [Paenibacillus sp. R14(2021)]|uniref:GNAT family N-acetyltransferase n=1 Tax=Paenibacillus sp. R14(2021) TaxID=2859228 RepID=UPI001C614315|nr:GNAT family N-acetyltransferase [Paenibacillus sp. R14(2021)]